MGNMVLFGQRVYSTACICYYEHRSTPHCVCDWSRYVPMSNTTTSGAPTLENISTSDLAKHVQSLTDRTDDLEQEVTEKDQRIANLRMNFEQKPIESKR